MMRLAYPTDHGQESQMQFVKPNTQGSPPVSNHLHNH